MGSLSDALPQGAAHQTPTGDPPLLPGPGGLGQGPLPPGSSNGSEQGEVAFEEETARVPRRKEWLSLRVHGNHKWRLLPFGCLNVGIDS